MRIKAVPVCYINPSKPELNQKVTVVCALTNLKKGTKVTSTSPMSLYNMAANAITKSVSPVIVQQIEMSDATEKLMFSWTLEQAVKDQAGNELNPLTDTAYASVTITAYEGSNGLGDDNNGADDTSATQRHARRMAIARRPVKEAAARMTGLARLVSRRTTSARLAIL